MTKKNTLIKAFSIVISVVIVSAIITGCSEKNNENTQKRTINEISQNNKIDYTYKSTEKIILSGTEADGLIDAYCSAGNGKFYGVWTVDLAQNDGDEKLIHESKVYLVSLTENGFEQMQEIYHCRENKGMYFAGLFIKGNGNIVGVSNEYEYNENNSYTSRFYFREYTPDFRLVTEKAIDDSIIEKIGGYLNKCISDGHNYYLTGEYGVYMFNTDYTSNGFIDVGISESSDSEWCSITEVEIGADGELYIFCSGNENGNGSFTKIETIDKNTLKVANTIDINDNMGCSYYFSGSDDYLFYGGSDIYLYGIKPDGTCEKILSWIDRGIDGSSLYNSVTADNGIIYYFNSTGSEDKSNCILKLIKLEKIPLSEVSERTEITLTAAGSLDDMWKNAIITYNNSSKDYYIKVDKLQEDESGSTLNVFDTAVLSGTVGDIIIPPECDSDKYISKGLYTDMYQFLDKDADLNRKSFFPSVLSAMETDGKLYGIWSTFKIETCAAPVKFVGNEKGLSYKKFLQLINDNPDKYVPSDIVTAQDMLKQLLINNYDYFVNTDTGECNFTSEAMKTALKIAHCYPNEIDYTALPESYWNDHELRFLDEKGILKNLCIMGVEDYIALRDAYMGGKYGVNILGMPTPDGGEAHYLIGNEICINANSSHKEAAWDFLKSILTYDKVNYNPYQFSGFSVIENTFDSIAQKRIDNNVHLKKIYGENYTNQNFGIDNLQNFTLKLATKEDYNIIKDTIIKGKSITPFDEDVMNIILEESSAYFQDGKTLNEVVELIQNRAVTCITEKL